MDHITLVHSDWYYYSFILAGLVANALIWFFPFRAIFRANKEKKNNESK